MKLYNHTFTPFLRGEMTSPQNWGKPKAWNRRATDRQRVGVSIHKNVNSFIWGEFDELIQETPMLDWVLTFKSFEGHVAFFDDRLLWARDRANVWLLYNWGLEPDPTALTALELIQPSVKGVVIDPFVSFEQWEQLKSFVERVDWVILAGEAREDNPRMLWTSWLPDIKAKLDSMGVKLWLERLGRDFASRHGLGNPVGDDPSEWPPYFAELRELPTAQPIQSQTPAQVKLKKGPVQLSLFD